jgi:hypothetical protein
LDWDGFLTQYWSLVDQAIMNLNLTTPILFNKIKHKVAGMYKFQAQKDFT